MTGQAHFDSYADAGVLVAVELVNQVALEAARGETTSGPAVAPVLARILAVDPPSAAQLRGADAPGFVALARRLHAVFGALGAGDVDAAAGGLNALLAEHPAQPHLAREGTQEGGRAGAGRWRLHHHPVNATLVAMWSSICAEALARKISAGQDDRLGTCERPGCGRVFFDLSKNARRRFCSTTCQNRVKAAAFRQRQGARARRDGWFGSSGFG